MKAIISWSLVDRNVPCLETVSTEIATDGYVAEFPVCIWTEWNV